MSPTPEALQKLIDRQEIVDVLVGYAVSMDGEDWDALERCFTEDAVCDFGDLGPGMHGASGIARDMRGVIEPMDASFHMVGNHVIDIDGDRASARSYLLAQHVLREALGGPIFFVAGIYHDELVRTADGWKIANKLLVARWTDGNPTIAPQARARMDAAQAAAGV